MKTLKNILLLPIICLALLAAAVALAEESIEDIRRQAEIGDAAAQYTLGQVYYNRARDDEAVREAVSWYRKAAEQGYAEAQYELGRVYQYGTGVKKDKREAVRWYSKATEQGHAEAQYVLGMLYWDGEGVVENQYEAYILYLVAKASGSQLAILFSPKPWSSVLTKAEIKSAKREATRRFAESGKRQEQPQSTDKSLSADMEEMRAYILERVHQFTKFLRELVE